MQHSVTVQARGLTTTCPPPIHVVSVARFRFRTERALVVIESELCAGSFWRKYLIENFISGGAKFHIFFSCANCVERLPFK